MPSSTPLRPVDDLSEDTPFRDRSDPSYQLHVHEQWTRFQNALPVESTHIPDMILRSWERCRAAGVKTRGVRPAHVPPDVFQQALSLNADLLESGRSLMSKLFAAISSGHSTISLTDSRGIVLPRGSIRGRSPSRPSREPAASEPVFRKRQASASSQRNISAKPTSNGAARPHPSSAWTAASSVR